MKRGHGYTILEVMIFVAISGLLLVSAMIAIGGRQQQVQFDQAARDFENKISDYINDVRVGYYAKDSGFSCSVSGTSDPAPVVTYTVGDSGDSNQGESGDCTLIGKVLVLDRTEQLNGVSLDDDAIRVVNMAGLRSVEGNSKLGVAGGIIDARPRALLSSSSRVESYAIKYGLSVDSVRRYRQGSTLDIEDASPVLAIMNTSGSDNFTTTIAVGSLENSGSVQSQLEEFENLWELPGENGVDYDGLAVCVSGPSGESKHTAALLVEPQGGVELLFDGSEAYCG